MADLQILRGTGARPRITFYANGLASDLDSGVPTVTITRPDGTTIASGTVTKVAATTGIYEFTLAPLAQVTVLTVTWAGPIGGVTETLTTTIEVVGGLLFTVNQFRAMRVAGGAPFAAGAVPGVTDTQIMDTRDQRAGRDDPDPRLLPRPPVRPRNARQLRRLGGPPRRPRRRSPPPTAVGDRVGGRAGPSRVQPRLRRRPRIRQSGYLLGSSITHGRRNVVVEYVHGTARPPGNGTQIAMLWAAAQLNPSGFSSATTVSLPTGESYTYEPSETGRGGFVRHTGIREVDRWLNRWSRPVAA